MRAVVQRVRDASVTVAASVVGTIDRGLLVYVGVEQGDRMPDCEYIANKVATMRIYPDGAGRMNLALADVDAPAGQRAGILAISQFTLHGDMRKGRRPNYNAAAPPDEAVALYEAVVKIWRDDGYFVQTGTFGAHMDVTSINDGPVTVLLDSKKVF